MPTIMHPLICRQCNMGSEAFRAKDNHPLFAHLCRECARGVPDAYLRDHYQPVPERKA